MGLDMYLEAERYVSGWKHSPEDPMYKTICEYIGIDPEYESGSPSGHVILHVGYWRKANAIHKWFVDNVQGGVDECQRSYVSEEDLNSLRALCQQALLEIQDGHLTNAGKLLPPQEGFFFGNNELDEWYIQQLERTIRLLNVALTLKDVTFYYQASW